MWRLFARDSNAVPAPSMAIVSVVFVGIGALLFANVVAALAGQSAARTPSLWSCEQNERSVALGEERL
jgi:hypothetical protein